MVLREEMWTWEAALMSDPTPFILLSLTFSSINRICSCVYALRGNITEDKRADFGIGLSGIKSQLCLYRLVIDLESVTESVFASFFSSVKWEQL